MFVLLIIIGFAGNLIGTLAGGGGLITLPTMLLLGMPIHSAIGANKVANTVSTFTNFLMALRKKELYIKEVALIVLLCLIGGGVGGIVASYFSEQTLTYIAMSLLLFAFFLSFLKKSQFGNIEKLALTPKIKVLLLAIGTYDGMFGPGSGTLLLYIFAYKNIRYYRAILYSRICIFATCLGAAIVYIVNGHILWLETFALLIGSVVGTQVAMLFAPKINATVAKWLLRCITVILIGEMAIELFH